MSQRAKDIIFGLLFIALGGLSCAFSLILWTSDSYYFYTYVTEKYYGADLYTELQHRMVDLIEYNKCLMYILADGFAFAFILVGLILVVFGFSKLIPTRNSSEYNDFKRNKNYSINNYYNGANDLMRNQGNSYPDFTNMNNYPSNNYSNPNPQYNNAVDRNYPNNVSQGNAYRNVNEPKKPNQ